MCCWKVSTTPKGEQTRSEMGNNNIRRWECEVDQGKWFEMKAMDEAREPEDKLSWAVLYVDWGDLHF